MRKKLLVCLTAAMLLFLMFPLPMIGAPWTPRTRITIIRDNYGVPHVYANTKEALGFGAGYAVAQDRLWQMDLYRKQAFGNLYEFGIGSINADHATRGTGYSRDELREIFDNWVPSFPEAKLKEMQLAYIDGVNLYISEALEAYGNGDPSLMPIEYLPGIVSPVGFPLEEFTIEDMVGIIVMMAWRFGATGGGELSLAARYEELATIYGDEIGWDIFNDLYPQQDPGSEVTIPEGGGYPEYLTQASQPLLSSNIGEIALGYEEFKMGQKGFLDSMGLPTKFGSNAWMVNPWKTDAGNALQVGGPQMGHSTPQIVVEMGLHGAGIDAVGMMMPHAPSVLIGVSKYGAWTSTTGSSDCIDTYIEVLNPANQYQYWYNGEWKDMEVRTERIYGPLKMFYEDREVYRTVHGPLIHPVYGWDLGNNIAYTMAVPFYKNELAAEEGWSLFQQAEDIQQMQEAARRVELSHNFYWIDTQGNIGYWHSGAYPIKPMIGKDSRLIDDRFPLWGTGEEEWIGLTGFDEMPKCINPDEGFMANWNNKPIADWPYREADWGQGHRVRRIQDLLAARDDFTFEDMNAINMDAGYNHIPAMSLLGFLVDAASSSVDPDIMAALPYLAAWDHHYNDVLAPMYPVDPNPTYDDPGLTIFDAWYDKIFDEVFDEAGVGGSLSLLIHVFDEGDSKLVLNYPYLNGEDKNDVINRALGKALDDLEIAFGTSDMSMWLEPVMMTNLWSQGALPTPRMHSMNRGTYNHIAEMPTQTWMTSSWWFRRSSAHAVNVIPPGQSGFFSIVTGPSPHAYDQLNLYDTWTYKPVRFSYFDVMGVAESISTLYL